VIPAFTRQDAHLSKSKALPAAAGSVQTDAIKIGSVGEPLLTPLELRISAPGLSTAQLPNANTAVYAILHGDTPDTLEWVATIGVQTGAGGEGAPGAEYRYRPPHNLKPFVAAKCTTNAAANASAAAMQLDVMF
jgi:hypothetical protein